MILCYSFAALTTTDLARQRTFWVDQLGFEVSEENPGEFFIVNAGNLRLCVDLADGDIHVAGGKDPVIGLKVDSMTETERWRREVSRCRRSQSEHREVLTPSSATPTEERSS
jgi:catechol 2,3-dioxygenase-like lactoylglutathione lyase family enzyme